MTKALTLITSVLNGRPYIEDMLASVPANPDIEHLVIDAGSADGTQELLQTRTGLRLIVRPGLPLYDAWNEALATAEGEYVLFLNADDVLVPGAIGGILSGLKESPDILCAEAEAFREGETLYHYRGEELTGLGWETLFFGAPLINAKIFRRQALLDAGGFDTSLSVASDRDLLLRLARAKSRLRIQYTTISLYRYRIHPGSKTLQQTARARLNIAREHCRIAQRMKADAALGEHVRQMAATWEAHERAVLAVRGLEARDPRASFDALSALCRGGFGSVAGIAAARRIRHTYAGWLRDAASHMPARSAGAQA